MPLATDQRGPGFPRIVSGTVDIGAFERPAVTNAATVYIVDLTAPQGASTGPDAGDLVYCVDQADTNTNLGAA